MSDTPHCPDCGNPLEVEQWSEELCPHCLLQLALEQSPGPGLDREETGTQEHNAQGLAQGKILGNRYGIRNLLGRGGMGEVWRAYDLKLRVDVALKTVRPDIAQQERVLQTLHQEVRAAREVISPNVCRVYDLQEIDGRELVSMEYIDGTTLFELLTKRGPLKLQEAREFASQFLAGLEAIHHAGLVHRDIKPENLMMTRTGRVVVMDFGIAKDLTAGQTGTVSGAPAYMAPEQGRGEAVDARADVFSAGVVLAEMLTPEICEGRTVREALWQGVRQDPPQLPDSPWINVLKTAVAFRREERYEGASDLARALEEVTIRVNGAEDVTPYPGLLAFTEQDREYFFGRELEAEALWKKIRRLSMLALIGPSGAGKTSFLRAGLLSHAPSGWSHVICTPGDAPVTALRQALAGVLSGDSEAIGELVKIEDPDAMVSAVSRWRSRSRHALLVVDQFEELFTLNPPEVQAQFTELLGRFVLDADLRVLLSMRDDFLIHCHPHEALKPILTELTLLGPPAGAALRRAVVQPALKCGYRFEDDALVDQILVEVEGERGALPLLAFAAGQLWQRRDREQGLLTREAYEIIGGVGGALAQHAELTLERIGAPRAPMVRKIFRNLVTSHGTRAVRGHDELLSVFKTDSGTTNRKAASEVLDFLIDARLLTSYGVEAPESDGEIEQRVEIVHESLLSSWPRLVRWQAQDIEGARMRDDLRQAARRWQERDRPDDLLWIGSAFREFRVWRERYPGSLSEIEEAFASTMVALAKRRRRRRRIVVGAVIAILLAVLAVIGVSRQQAIDAAKRAMAETRRADAASLVALGQLELDSYPTAAVAHVIASLERSDSTTARRLALEALWKGPTALVAYEGSLKRTRFSPDGRSLVMQPVDDGDPGTAQLTIFRADGSNSPLVNAHDPSGGIFLSLVWPSGHFWTYGSPPDADISEKIVLWSFDQKQPLAETTLSSSQTIWMPTVDSKRERLVLFIKEEGRTRVDALGFDGVRKHLGTLDFDVTGVDPDRFGAYLCAVANDQVFTVEIGDHDLGSPRLVGRHEGASRVVCDPLRRFVVTTGEDGRLFFWPLSGQKPPFVEEGPPKPRIRAFVGYDGAFFCAGSYVDGAWSLSVWDMSADRPRFLRRFNLGEARRGLFRVSASGRLIVRSGPYAGYRIWPFDGPADSDPILLSRGDNLQANPQLPNFFAIHPHGDWIATTDHAGLAFWPLGKKYPLVIRRHKELVSGLAFAPDGSWITSASSDGTVRTWPLVGDPPPRGSIQYETDSGRLSGAMAVSPNGEKLIAGSNDGRVQLISLDGSRLRVLEGFSEQTRGVAFSQDGRLAAACARHWSGAEDRMIRIWDVATGDEVAVLEIEERPTVRTIQFLANEQLLFSTVSGLWRWDVGTGEQTLLYRGNILTFAAGADGRRALMVESESISQELGKVVLLDVESGTATELEEFGSQVLVVASDQTASIVATGDRDGEVRVGLMNGGEPHLLIGHEGLVQTVAVDPQGRWIASGGQDKTIRLWPMPDFSKPPLHALPREELIAKLKTLTNLRVVRDEESATGWKLTHDPFPGWETEPTW